MGRCCREPAWSFERLTRRFVFYFVFVDEAVDLHGAEEMADAFAGPKR